MLEKRAKNGQFLPGTVPNPGGRPRADPEVKEILKAAAPEAARKLVELLDSKQEKIRFMAIKEILDRTQGKPEGMQKIELSSNQGETITFRWINERDNSAVQPTPDTVGNS